MFQIVSCVITDLSWTFHENPFSRCSVMLLKGIQTDKPTPMRTKFRRSAQLMRWTTYLPTCVSHSWTALVWEMRDINSVSTSSWDKEDKYHEEFMAWEHFPFSWIFVERIYLYMLYYSDVIMRLMASQITGMSIVYSTVCSGEDQRKHQSSASLAFVRVIHRWLINSPHKGPITRKMFPFDYVIVILSWVIFTPSSHIWRISSLPSNHSIYQKSKSRVGLFNCALSQFMIIGWICWICFKIDSALNRQSERFACTVQWTELIPCDVYIREWNV